jgi:hypothetical protein
MMKNNFYKATVAIVLMMSATFLSGQSVSKETRKVSGFTEIGFGVAGTLTIKTGSEFSVMLEGDKEYLSEIETVVRDNKLFIRNYNNHFFNNEKVDVFVTLPELKGIGVSGSGSARTESKIKADKIYLNVSGSGKIYVSDLEADQFESGISGSGDVIINGTGSADKGTVHISGSGSYKGESFEIDHLEVHISGSGSCSCKAGDELNAHVSGSGSVYYYGNPRVDARVSGSGHVRSR